MCIDVLPACMSVWDYWITWVWSYRRLWLLRTEPGPAEPSLQPLAILVLFTLLSGELFLLFILYVKPLTTYLYSPLSFILILVSLYQVVCYLLFCSSNHPPKSEIIFLCEAFFTTCADVVFFSCLRCKCWNYFCREAQSLMVYATGWASLTQNLKYSQDASTSLMLQVKNSIANLTLQ